MSPEERKSAIAAWQTRLTNTFSNSNSAFANRLQLLFEAEGMHREVASMQFAGFTALLSSFQDFVLMVHDQCLPTDVQDAGFCWAILAASFRRLRAALNNYYEGYYFDAAGSLRGIFENMLYLASVMNGHIDEFAMLNIQNHANLATEKEKFSAMEKERRKMEKEIYDNMFGVRSGLASEEQISLERFFKLLHLHVHRTQSSLIYDMTEWREKRLAPSFFPKFNLRWANVFATPAAIVAWLYLRTFVGILIRSVPSAETITRYRILDESFKFYVVIGEGATSNAVIELISRKFSFDQILR